MKVLTFFFALVISSDLMANTSIVLKEVMGNTVKHLALEPEVSPILFLFGENCSFCKDQVKELECLDQNQIDYVAIMLMKDEKLAFKEKQKLNLKKELFLSNERFEEAFQIKKIITPTIIIPNKKKFSVVFGKKTCDEIKNYGKN